MIIRSITVFLSLFQVTSSSNYQQHLKNNEISDHAPIISFSAVGDWGGVPVKPYQVPWGHRVAKSMNRIAPIYDTDFMLLIGDNFYWDGVKNLEDDRFENTFQKTFDQEKLPNLSNMPMFIQTGNHDYHGNITAQVLYTNSPKNVNNRWKFPYFWYKINFPEMERLYDFKVEIFMIDTMALQGFGSKDFSSKEEIENRKFEQYQWLEFELANSEADFIVVAGHHPIFSISTHGPTKILVDELLPILEKYNVNFYVCGHDHQLQFLKYKDDDSKFNQKPQFVVAGMATLPNPRRVNRNSLPDYIENKFFYSKTGLKSHGGYVQFVIHGDKIRVYYIDAKTDEVIYSSSSGKRVIPGKVVDKNKPCRACS